MFFDLKKIFELEQEPFQFWSKVYTGEASPLVLNQSEWQFDKMTGDGKFQITNVFKKEVLYFDIDTSNVLTAKLEDIPSSGQHIWNVFPEKNKAVSQGTWDPLTT